MTRSVRIMCFTMGLLLIASALAVAALPVANFWPWTLLFGSAGVGLFVGAYVAMEDASAEKPSEVVAASQEPSKRLPGHRQVGQ